MTKRGILLLRTRHCTSKYTTDLCVCLIQTRCKMSTDLLQLARSWLCNPHTQKLKGIDEFDLSPANTQWFNLEWLFGKLICIAFVLTLILHDEVIWSMWL